MPYQLTLADLGEPTEEELKYSNQYSQPKDKKGGYKLTLADLDRIDAKERAPQQAPQGLLQGLMQPDQAAGEALFGQQPTIQEIGGDIARFGKGAAEGLGGILSGPIVQQMVQQSPAGAAFNLAEQAVPGLAEARTKRPDFLTEEERATPAAQAGEFVGESLPFLAVPGGAITKVPRAIERALAGASAPARIAGRAASRAAKGAAVGAPVNVIARPEESPLDAAQSGGTLGALTSLALSTIGGAPGAVARRIPKLFGGKASPEEIAARLQAAERQGLNIPIGDIIDSGTLKKIQTGLSHIPFVGLSKTYSDASKAIQEGYKGRLQSMLPDSPIGEKMVDSLTELTKKTSKNVSKLYKKVDDHAVKTGFKVELPSYKAEVDRLTKDIKRVIPEKKLTASDTELKKIVSSLENVFETRSPLSKALGTAAASSPTRSYSDAKIALKYLREGYDKAKVDPSMKNVAGQFSRLEQKLRKDVANSIDKSGDEKLKRLSKTADEYFKKREVPLREKEIVKFTRREGDPDTVLQSFIKTGQYERPKLLSKLVSKLSDRDRDAVASSYLTKGLAEDATGALEFSPTKIATAYNKLGKRQQKTLFSPAERKQFDDLSTLSRLMGTNLDQMANPKTGAQAASMLGQALLGAGIYGATHLGEGDGSLSSIALPFLAPYLAKKGIMSKSLRRTLKGGRQPRMSQRQQNIASSLPFLLQNQEEAK